MILSGGEGIDLSVGKVATFTAIIGSRIMDGQDANILAGTVIPLVVAAFIGLVNALGIVYLKIPPFVMTLGMLGVVQGLILAYTGGSGGWTGRPRIDKPGERASGVLGSRRAVHLAASRHPHHAFAAANSTGLESLRRGDQPHGGEVVGRQREPHDLHGLHRIQHFRRSRRTPPAWLYRVGLSGPRDQYTLPSVAAVVVGGTLISGGIGGYVGSAIGAIVLTVLESLLTTVNMPSASRIIVNGVVLVMLLALYGRQKRLRG